MENILNTVKLNNLIGSNNSNNYDLILILPTVACYTQDINQ
jgi:hypothetical protein